MYDCRVCTFVRQPASLMAACFFIKIIKRAAMGVVEKVKLWIYRYELTFGLYMLEPIEKIIFNSFLIIFLVLFTTFLAEFRMYFDRITSKVSFYLQ